MIAFRNLDGRPRGHVIARFRRGIRGSGGRCVELGIERLLRHWETLWNAMAIRLQHRKRLQRHTKAETNSDLRSTVLLATRVTLRHVQFSRALRKFSPCRVLARVLASFAGAIVSMHKSSNDRLGQTAVFLPSRRVKVEVNLA